MKLSTQVKAVYEKDKTRKFDVTKEVPSLGLLLTKLKFSTQQKNDEHETNNVWYKQTSRRRFALYDTEVDKGSPREELTTTALVLS